MNLFCISDASVSLLTGRGVSILTPDQVPGGMATSSFKTIAVENKLFDVKKVKEASARAAASKARRPANEPGTTAEFINAPVSPTFGSQLATSGSVAKTTDFAAPGAFRTFVGGGFPSMFPSANINVDVRFGQTGDERSTGSNIASVQTDGSFLGLPSRGKTPSTVSKSPRTKFHDQASLLAMVSEQISKRTSTISPRQFPREKGTVRRTRPTDRMPFTGPASAWGQPSLRNMDVFIPNSPRPRAAVRVDLPPPPIDLAQVRPTQQTIGVNPTVAPFPQVPSFMNNGISKDFPLTPRSTLDITQPMDPFVENNLQQNTVSSSHSETAMWPESSMGQVPNVDIVQSTLSPLVIATDFSITAAPTTIIPDMSMSAGGSVNATSFFLDPISTDPFPTIDVPTIQNENIKPESAVKNVKPRKDSKSKNLSGSDIVNISIVDVTNATVANDSAVQYDMTPFQNNENWAIFDPSMPANVNFSDYGPILDIPIDTNQISFTSNSDPSFSSVFSQASSPSTQTKKYNSVDKPVSTKSSQSSVTSLQTRLNKIQPQQFSSQTEVTQSVLKQSKKATQPMTSVVNMVPLPADVQFISRSIDSGPSQQPIDLPMPPPPPF